MEHVTIRDIARICKVGVSTVSRAINNHQGKDYAFVLQQVEEEENEIMAAIRIARERRLKGIIFMGGASQPDVSLLKALTIPYVFCTVDSRIPESLSGWGIVAIDNEAESYKIVDYLCSKGHRRIAILTAYAHDTSIGKLRLDTKRDGGAGRGREATR